MEKWEVTTARLTWEELASLRAYTDAWYIKINQFLQMLDTEKRDEFLKPDNTWATTVNLVCRAFYKMGKNEEIVKSFLVPNPDANPEDSDSNQNILPTAYRGMRGKMTDDFLIPDQNGEISYVAAGFSSTTTDKDVCDSFRDTTNFNIMVTIVQRPNDAIGSHTGISVQFCSKYPGEKEILLPPGTHFKILKKRKEGFALYLETICTYNFEDFEEFVLNAKSSDEEEEKTEGSKFFDPRKVMGYTANVNEPTYVMQSWENGEVYEGMMKGKVKHGYGQQSFSNGNIYEGLFVYGKRQGFGKMTWNSVSEFQGDVYEGMWHDDMSDGVGRYTKSNGASTLALFEKGKIKKEIKE